MSWYGKELIRMSLVPEKDCGRYIKPKRIKKTKEYSLFNAIKYSFRFKDDEIICTNEGKIKAVILKKLRKNNKHLFN